MFAVGTAKALRTRVWLLLTVLLLSCLDPARADDASALRLGIFAYRPADQMQRMWEPIASFLEKRLGDRKVELRVLDQDQLAQAIQNGELDVVFTNPTHYIRLRADNHLSGAIATQVTVQNGKAVSELGGVVIRRADRSDLVSLESLVGKRIAIPGREYLGGYLSQVMLLKEHGIDLDDIEFVSLGNPHDLIVQAVVSGEVDAGFIRTGILESLSASGSPVVDQIEVVEPRAHQDFPFITTTRLYPEWAIVAMPELDQNVARRLTAALLSLDSSDPAAKAAGIYGFSIPKDYRAVEEAMVSLRVPPFEAAPEVSWFEFFNQNRITFLLSLLLFLSLLSAGLVLLWFERRLRAAKRQTDLLNQRFQDLSDNVPGVLFQYRQRADGSSHFPLVSARIQTIYGCTASQVQDDARPVFDVIHPDDREAVRRSIEESARQMSVWHAAYRILHPQRGEIWVEGSSTPTAQEDGSVVWHGLLLDITELQRSRQALRLAGQVVHFTSDGVLILDKNGQVEQVNPAFVQMTGYDLATLKARGLNNLDPVSFPAHGLAVRVDRRETVWTSVSGERCPVLLSISPVRSESGDITQFVIVAKDISEMRAKQDELDRLAHYDALTGLPNRRLLTDRLEQAVAHAKRTGERLALAMLDLDSFKPVNDRYGHEAGDRLLIEIAKRLRQAVREEDTVARLGGDEFTLILWNVDGETVFKRVIDCVQMPVQLDEATVHVSASMGITFFDIAHPLNGEQLMRQADVALYQSKEQGRNRYTLFQ